MRTLRCAARSLSLKHPQIMGVLNITPDSFSDGGQLLRAGQPDLQQVQRAAAAMIAQGATMLDVGGESTRPGATAVSVAEELQRVIPVVEVLCELDTIVSVDTRHAEVAAAAIGAGAHLINDISAGADPDMLAVIAQAGVGYAIMHMQGSPQTMQQAPVYHAVVQQVREFLEVRYQAGLAAGITSECMMVDPGFGFGKSLEHNLTLLAHLSELRFADRPILVGLSRKSMLGRITGRPVHDRVGASVAAAMLAVERGADVLRVHDVAQTQDALKLHTAVQAAQ